jgi:coenzyme F420-0:L-glutamate ligase / coenzyme F420-1:gamma-L-glutamate ligase
MQPVDIDNQPLVYRRRMIRRYTHQVVEPRLIDDLIDAGTRAPSPHNRQPWRFALIQDDARIHLAQAMGNQLRTDLARDGMATELIERDISRSYERITSAPVSILVCMSMTEMDVYPDQRRLQAERWMAGQAVAAAIQNILLRATELGLGACWMCAPLFCQQVVVNILDLTPDWEPQALITLGYPADQGTARDRHSAQSVTVTITRVKDKRTA